MKKTSAVSFRSAQATAGYLKLLNQKESQVLALMVKGFNTIETCKMLNLKSREVEMHRYNIKLKLKLRTHKAVVANVTQSAGFNFYAEHGIQKE
jgi:DNA-binding CsgD family transcriptional regulator